MMAGLAFLLMFIAFVVIAASMSRHRQPLGSGQLPHAQLYRWRMAGYVLLAASIWPCLLRWNPSIAVALWFGLLTLAAVMLGLLLTYAPGLARCLNVMRAFSNTACRR